MSEDKNISKEDQNQKDSQKDDFPGYPKYPKSEDIYQRAREKSEIDPEDVTRLKTPNESPDSKNHKGFKDDLTGADLDVPGSELDDQQEDIGSEDEENNYYSLGGDSQED